MPLVRQRVALGGAHEKAPSRDGLVPRYVYRILRDGYYIGIVTHKGVKGEGRPEATIDRETFEKVQQILAVATHPPRRAAEARAALLQRRRLRGGVDGRATAH